jgi:tetratricopeptide (TPR) repeat protein
MAQPASNPKIDELRSRLKADPKSRIFYPLAEELRKVSQYTEAEQVLHTGLANHPTYLSAWVSLGRVMRDLGQNEQAVEALTKALQLDPGNVVAARILADAYLALGEKVEAIKKYKLVHALLPSDEELEAVIERLEKELHPPAPVPVEPEPVAIPEAAPEQPPVMDETPWASEPEAAPEPEVFAATEDEQGTGDAIPMAATHAESPFEEPAADLGYSADAFSIEQPDAMHIEPMPMSAELPSEVMPAEFEPEPEAEPADFFAPAAEPEPEVESEPEPVMEIGLASDMPFPITAELPPPAADDFSKTITMADLYAKQGLVDEARDIYEDILARDPNNDGVRAKLDALTGDVAQPLMSEPEVETEPEYEAEPAYAAETVTSATPTSKIARLEGWLAKVARRDIGGV